MQGAGTQTQALPGGGTPAFAWGQGECRVVREVSQGSNVTCLLSLKGPGVIQAERRRARRLWEGDTEMGDGDCGAIVRGSQMDHVVRLETCTWSWLDLLKALPLQSIALLEGEGQKRLADTSFA